MTDTFVCGNQSILNEVNYTLDDWMFRGELLEGKVKHAYKTAKESATQMELSADGKKISDIVKLLPEIKKRINAGDDCIVVRDRNGIQGVAIVQMLEKGKKKTPYLKLKYLITSPYNLDIGSNREYTSVKKGIGTRLVQKMVELCRSKKGKYIELVPTESAVPFYRKLKFKNAGTIEMRLQMDPSAKKEAPAGPVPSARLSSFLSSSALAAILRKAPQDTVEFDDEEDWQV